MSPSQIAPACRSLIAPYRRARSSLEISPVISPPTQLCRQHCRCNDETELKLSWPSFDPCQQEGIMHLPRAFDRLRGSSDSAAYPGRRRGIERRPQTGTVLNSMILNSNKNQLLRFRRMKLTLLEIRMQGRSERYLLTDGPVGLEK